MSIVPNAGHVKDVVRQASSKVTVKVSVVWKPFSVDLQVRAMRKEAWCRLLSEVDTPTWPVYWVTLNIEGAVFYPISTRLHDLRHAG